MSKRIVLRSDHHGYQWAALARGGGYVMIQQPAYRMLPRVVTTETWASWPIVKQRRSKT